MNFIDPIDHEYDKPRELDRPEIDRLAMLQALARKVLWLSSWTIHNANHERESRDGLKVGGHQASCASLVTLMTALYLDVLRPEDRVAVKPHASPVFHALQYLLGNQTREKLAGFRALGGAQSYPSRTKDSDDVDFSTGSVGLGVATTSFAALVQDYLAAKDALPPGRRPGRMVALVGDAELDEGNVYEALLEGWKHDVRNVWWVVDYNRQSLDSVISDRLFSRFNRLFASMGWKVVTLKYGRKLRAAFERPGGEALRQWIDACPNSLYSALVYKGGAAWRERVLRDIGHREHVPALVARYDDEALAELMTNLGGHDMETVLEAFRGVEDDQPTCFIAYTIKGHGLPFAGHKDNHAGLMSPADMETYRASQRIRPGEEWSVHEGLGIPAAAIEAFLREVPFARGPGRRLDAARIEVPPALPVPGADTQSTQECFGRILDAIARQGGPLADHLVTTSPDVTVSTNLGGWVNRRHVFHREAVPDTFDDENVGSFQRWSAGPEGQHLELGIAENNLFLALGALGLAHSLFGHRLLPIGTLYDPFIERGLDALNYACYQDARFMLVATPSGITLAPEGGAHQSIATPMIGMAQDRLAAFEPAYADELGVVMRWALEHMQRDEAPAADDLLGDASGGSTYLRLSTRKLNQPSRTLSEDEARAIIDGGYWLREPGETTRTVIAYTGAVAPEALAAAEAGEDHVALLAITSADRLYQGWERAQARRRAGAATESHVERLLAPIRHTTPLVTVLDGHPATLGWLGSVHGHAVRSLGVTRFGQSGDIDDLYRTYGIDADSIVAACAQS